jgi:hypothetical protein
MAKSKNLQNSEQPKLLELTDWPEIFTENTVYQDKFSGLSNLGNIFD